MNVRVSVEVRSRELGTHNTSVDLDVDSFGESIDCDHPTLDAFFATFEDRPEGDILKMQFTMERLDG